MQRGRRPVGGAVIGGDQPQVRSLTDMWAAIEAVVGTMRRRSWWAGVTTGPSPMSRLANVAVVGHVFVSHSSDEAALARQLVGHLETSGHRCWLATRDVGGSDDYTQQVIRSIDSCSFFVVLMTSAAMHSPHVRRELERAIGDSKRILPVRVDGVVLDESSSYLLAGCQWVDLSSAQPHAGFEAISGVLRDGPPGLPMREPPPFYEVLSRRTSDVGIKVRHPGASIALVCSCTVVLSPLGLLLGLVYLLTPGRSPEGRITAGSAVAIGIGGTVLLVAIIIIIATVTGSESAGIPVPANELVL